MPQIQQTSPLSTQLSIIPFRNFCRDDSGSAAVEYALMVGVLSGIMLASIQTLGRASSGSFEQVAQTMESVATARENAPQATTIEAPTPITIAIPIR